MLKIFKKFRDKIKFKEDLPPPYRANDIHNEIREAPQDVDPQFEALDLLANCKIDPITPDSDVEYAEIREDMGIWHSTPLTKRHKSKISLTWVLKENLEKTRPNTKQKAVDKQSYENTFNNYQRHMQLIEHEKKERSQKRVEGRNEQYHLKKISSEHNLKYQKEHPIHYHTLKANNTKNQREHQLNSSIEQNLKSITERNNYHRVLKAHKSILYTNRIIDGQKRLSRSDFDSPSSRYQTYESSMKLQTQSVYDMMMHPSYSEDSGGEELRRRRRRHRKKKRRPNGKIGYDIRDLDCFLSEATIDRPGNIPVVIAYPTTLYITHHCHQRELTLPLGTVVNAVFKSHQWVYAQTPHGAEGYVSYSACLPLGILPSRAPSRKTPCWESSTDIYPRPCGNLTDNDKHEIRIRTKSECNYRTSREKRRNNTTSCAEKDFDTLYLRTKSFTSIDKTYDGNPPVVVDRKQMFLIVNKDFKGHDYDRTLSVNHGDVVVLVEKGERDDWFLVRKGDGSEGFIPAAVVAETRYN